MMTAESDAVAMTAIRKSFGEVEVLRGVDFSVRRGEVHALLGGNGAGKSTLMKILLGVHQPHAGTLEVDGSPVSFRTPNDAREAGLAMVFQDFSLTPSLSVARNIMFGREPRRFGLIDDRALHDEAQAILDRLGVDVDPRKRLSSLPVGLWQLTEIAKAIGSDAQVLILDEPTATLSYHEVEILFQIIDRLKQQGVAIIYISHRMAEIARVADRLSILRDGARVVTADVGSITPEDVAEAVVGRQIHSGRIRGPRAEHDSSTPILEVRGISVEEKIRDMSFEVRRGEILGIAGLIGSGRSELVEAIAGIRDFDAGEILIEGRSLRAGRVKRMLENGVMLVPENRQKDGLVLGHSIRANILLPSLKRIEKAGLIDDRRGQSIVHSLVERLQIKAAGVGAAARTLSGGNQQKVVLAKWLGLRDTGQEMNVFLLDEPTNGVDIGTKTEILRLIAELADAGSAVLLISSELEELLAISDRVLVLREGQIVDDLRRDQIENEQALQLAIQGV